MECKTKKPHATYCLYKGDEVIGFGTVLDLAEMTGRSQRMIYRFAEAQYARQNRGNAHIAVRIDKEDEEW